MYLKLFKMFENFLFQFAYKILLMPLLSNFLLYVLLSNQNPVDTSASQLVLSS